MPAQHGVCIWARGTRWQHLLPADPRAAGLVVVLAVHAVNPPKEDIATPSSSSASLMRPLGKKGDKQGQSKRVSATSPHSFHRQTMISCCERCLLCLEILFFLPVPSCLLFPGRLQTLMVITNTSERYSADLAPAKTFFFFCSRLHANT